MESVAGFYCCCAFSFVVVFPKLLMILLFLFVFSDPLLAFLCSLHLQATIWKQYNPSSVQKPLTGSAHIYTYSILNRVINY